MAPARPEPARRTGRSQDREILLLALPALGALAAEPSYLLVDTAIVGHLGTTELAALALAATALAAVVTLLNFLAYGTTAQVARLHGAGEAGRAGLLAAQALWLAAGLGVLIALLLLLLAGPVVAVLGGTGHTADLAARYMRLSAPGIPLALIAVAGQGYLRGVGDLRTPLVILVAANLANAVLEVVLVYGAGFGLDGSAVGTVVAQGGMGVAFAIALLRAPASSRRPDPARLRALLRMGSDLVIRTAALLGAFTVASAILARSGDAALSAHQIAFQLFVFLALVLDAIAIAGQVLVGRMLGAGDAGGARRAALRMVGWSLVVGTVFGLALLAGTSLIPRAFSDDDAVLAQARDLWPLFALMQPIGGVVFALDGILIGAGDTRYIARSMAAVALVCFAPLAAAAAVFGWGVTGVWCAIVALMLGRLVTMGARFRTGHWAVAGATARPA